MGVFSRIPDIINSNINALLDKAEDPEKMVRLIIQEMEGTLVEVRSTSARAIADRKDMERRRERLSQEMAEWDRKAELAVSKGRDDLARAALVEKSKAEDVGNAVATELEALNETLAKLNQDIHALQQKIKDAKSRQNAIVMRGQAAQTRLGIRRQLNDHSIDDAMTRFEQYERKMDELEGQVESYDLGQRSLRDQIDDLAVDESVDEELRQLKARIKGAGETGTAGETGAAGKASADKSDGGKGKAG